MPVTTSSNNPPDVEVIVTNGGGGGANQNVGVYVAWDPACLAASSPTPSSGVVFVPSEGFCIWYGYTLTPGNPMRFQLTLRRRNGRPTWVHACKMDPTTNTYEPGAPWPVPNNHP